MKTIRRIYLYAVAVVSLETVVWGTINLARTLVAGRTVVGNASQLAGALALILVGVPIFLLHWWFAQRQASQDPEEHAARTRAIFLYGSLLATGVPVAQNILALINRLLGMAFGLTVQSALVGRGQTINDNLIAILINLIAVAYLIKVATSDWKALNQVETLADTRRLFRYVWLLYGLGLLVFGAQQTIAYIFGLPQAIGFGSRSMLANGLASLLVGASVWASFQRMIEQTLDDQSERESSLRLAILFVLALGGVGLLLGASGLVLYQLMRGLFGAGWLLGELLAELSYPLSIAIPAGTIWAFYGRLFNLELAYLKDTLQQELLRRFYRYLLSFMGLGATFFGARSLLAYILDVLFGPYSTLGLGFGDRLAGAFALITVGLPLWVYSWGMISALARLDGEVADRARRSLIRKTYIYGILFAGVLGLMFSAGTLLYQLLSALLGDPPEQLYLQALQLSGWLLLFGVFLAYHWHTMRADNLMAEKALARRYSMYPVLVLAEDGAENEFSIAVLEALARQTPALPVAVHPYSQGVPDETLSAARAVILPAELVAQPSEALRLWLQGYDGSRIVVPTPSQDWLWVYGSGRTLKSLANQAARAVRQLAEDEPISSPQEASPWMAAVYLLAGLAALEITALTVSIIASLLLR